MAMPARAERLLKPLETLIERMVSVGLVSSGVVLAAQTFLALIPLLLAVTALLPAAAADGVQASLRERFGISGNTDAAVSDLINNRDQLRGGLTVLGAIVVLASATSFTQALQRVYEQAWGLPRLGLRGRVRGVMWLLGLVGSVYVPRSVRASERQFGTIGAVFAIESWLIVVACVLVGAAVVAAVAAQADGPLGRLWRGTTELDGWRRT